eukprot:gene601-1160_t
MPWILGESRYHNLNLRDNNNRSITEKSEQLKAIINCSAIIAAFVVCVLCNVKVPEYPSTSILDISYGIISSAACACSILGVLSGTFLLLGIYRYNYSNRNIEFQTIWKRRCQNDWKIVLRTFSWGIPLFLLMMALVGWVAFSGLPGHIPSAICITIVSMTTLIFAWNTSWRKWNDFLFELCSDFVVETPFKILNSLFSKLSVHRYWRWLEQYSGEEVDARFDLHESPMVGF